MTNAERQRGWGFRVVSERDTEPDTPEGQRILSLYRVWFDRDDEIMALDDRPTWRSSSYHTINDMLVELSMIEAALHHPALIKAEWQHRQVRRVALQDTRLAWQRDPDPNWAE